MASKYVGRHRAQSGTRASGLGLAGRSLRRAGVTLAFSATAVGGYVVTTSGPGRAALADRAATMDLAAAAPAGATASSDTARNGAPGAVGAAQDAPVSMTELDAQKASANRSHNTQNMAMQAAAAAAAAQLAAERKAEAERAARDAERQAIIANARANPKAVAQVLVAERGWNDAQFQCLVKLWTKESNWNYAATNRSSGAYGIPQSLPGSKMASVAADWRTNPVTQITWGLKYISSVYGTPCNAWGHSQRTNWY